MQVRDVIFNCDVEQVIEELRTQLQLNGIQYLEKEPKRSRDSLQVQCPFHGDGMERKPSGGITLIPIKKGNRTVEAGTFHCFACGKVCDLPEFISYCFGEPSEIGTFGWQWLCKNFLSLRVEERKGIELDFGNRSSSNNHNSVHLCNYVSEEELDKYRYYHPYWKERGITDERIIELFDLGYDKETACITMPVRDKSGHTLFIARRSVKTKFFNYPEGVEKPLYGLFEIWSAACKVGTEYEYGKKVKDYYSQILFPKEVIVCESMIDALTCWQYGKYAVALNGLGNDLQFKQLNELPCRKLILATDNDEAGMKARKRIRNNINTKLVTEYILPAGKKDINELNEEEFRNLQEYF